MKGIFPKSKLLFVNLVILLIIIGGIRLVESGPEPWLDSEKVFMAQLHNSLWNLDRAKYQWATEKNKPEDAIPTFDDLAPYLGEWKNTIEKLKALGVEYKITSTETTQSDVATLTQGIRFRAAILVSLLPATCILWAFLSAWFVPLPYHARERDTKRIIEGMTKAQVLEAIGLPRGSSSGDRKTRSLMIFRLRGEVQVGSFLWIS